MITLKLTQDEFNNVLAAVRHWQESGMCEPENRPDNLHDIATDGGLGQSMSDSEMDEMIELWQWGRTVAE